MRAQGPGGGGAHRMMGSSLAVLLRVRCPVLRSLAGFLGVTRSAACGCGVGQEEEDEVEVGSEWGRRAWFLRVGFLGATRSAACSEW